MASPPKPWERRAAEARASSSSITAPGTGTVTATATGVSAGGGASTSALAASSAVPAVSSSVPATSTTPNGLQPAPYQHYGSSYDSSYPSHGAGSMYGSSLYGGNGSMYGNSMYGSGSIYGGGSSMYGSSMYGGGGSMYGNSMYGGGYGNRQFGYGLNPLQKAPGAPFTNALVHNGQNFIEGVHQHVSTFGRFSQILHMNFEALHMSFSSLLQLLSNVSMLKQEFGAIFSTFGGLRALYVIFLKARSFVLRALGMSSAADRHEMGKVWSEVKNSNWGWFPILLTASCFAWLVKRFFALLMGRKAARARPSSGSRNDRYASPMMSQASSRPSPSPGGTFAQQSPFQQYYDQKFAFEHQWAE